MRKEFIINSANRVSGELEDFILPIGQPRRIKLLYSHIPDTYNNLSGTLQIIGAVSGTNIINIVANKYTPASFVAYLNSNIIIPGQTYTAVLGELNRVTVVATEAFTISNLNVNLDLSVNLGFSTIPSPSITSASLNSVLNPPLIFICSQQVRGVDNIIIAGQESENIIHAVPFGNYTPTYDCWVHVFGELRNFYLRFQNNFPVGLNENDWCIKLLAEY
jgi:hypothetical protein